MPDDAKVSFFLSRRLDPIIFDLQYFAFAFRAAISSLNVALLLIVRTVPDSSPILTDLSISWKKNVCQTLFSSTFFAQNTLAGSFLALHKLLTIEPSKSSNDTSVI